jgi:hypothetical protein
MPDLGVGMLCAGQKNGTTPLNRDFETLPSIEPIQAPDRRPFYQRHARHTIVRFFTKIEHIHHRAFIPFW